tara:strand:+ start:58 stop:348 length:291 start_codon:yes stop_codon:yes gene_type:complete
LVGSSHDVEDGHPDYYFPILNNEGDIMRVGDLVKVTHPNGSGYGSGLVPYGTIGVVTRVFGDRFHKGEEWEEIQVVACGVGHPHTYYSSSWKVISK